MVLKFLKVSIRKKKFRHCLLGGFIGPQAPFSPMSVNLHKNVVFHERY